MISRYQRRKAVNILNLVFASLATAFALFVLGAILWALCSRGLPEIKWSTLTEMTPPPGDAGGLANAIYGSLLMTLVAMFLGAPLGVLAGTYLAEYGRYSKISSVIRFVNDILLSAPSILIGMFVYEVLVVSQGHFSGWSGAVALAIIVIPVVVRTTEDMLSLVPQGLREAAAGLGAPQWIMIAKVAYRAARSGIVTGLLLAVARVSGETAPLLFTALNNQFFSRDMNAPMANLPVVIYQFALSPYPDWRSLAWAGATLITLTILALNIVARTLTSRGTEQ
jgi:phosphate transport system permease protein